MAWRSERVRNFRNGAIDPGAERIGIVLRFVILARDTHEGFDSNNGVYCCVATQKARSA